MSVMKGVVRIMMMMMMVRRCLVRSYDPETDGDWGEAPPDRLLSTVDTPPMALASPLISFDDLLYDTSWFDMFEDVRSPIPTPLDAAPPPSSDNDIGRTASIGVDHGRFRSQASTSSSSAALTGSVAVTTASVGHGSGPECAPLSEQSEASSARARRLQLRRIQKRQSRSALAVRSAPRPCAKKPDAAPSSDLPQATLDFIRSPLGPIPIETAPFIEFLIEQVRLAERAALPLALWPTSRTRLFRSTVWPVLACLQHHFTGDRVRFMAAYGERLGGAGHAFPCAGVGVRCGPGGYVPCPVSGPEWDRVDFGPLLALKLTTPTRDSLDVIRRLSDRIDGIVSLPPPGLLHYVTAVVRPVMACFRHHCGADVDEFARRWGDPFPHRNFGVRFCPGAASFRQAALRTRVAALPPSAYHDPTLPPPDVPDGDFQRDWAYERFCRYGLALSASAAASAFPSTVGHVVDAVVCGYDLGTRLDRAPDLVGHETGDLGRDLDVMRAYEARTRHLGLDNVRHGFFALIAPVRDIVFCLREHCGDSVDEFRRRWPRFRFATFAIDGCGRRKKGGCRSDQIGKSDAPNH